MDGHYKKKILYNNMSRNLNLTSTTSSKIILENITVSSGTGLESVSGKLYFNGEEVRSGGGLTHSAQILTSDGEIDFSNTSTLLKTGHVYTLPDGETIGFKKDIVNNDRGTNTNLIVSSNVKGGNITGVVGQVRDIESTTNGNIYIGGDFTLLSDGTPASRIAVYNTNTNLWSNIKDENGDMATLNGAVYGITSDNGNNIFVGGEFNEITTTSQTIYANGIAMYNSSTNKWSNLFDSFNNINGIETDLINDYYAVNKILLLDNYNSVYIGGDFSNLSNGTSCNGLAVFNRTNNTWSGITGVGNGIVRTIESTTNGDIYVGGNFNALSDGTSANGIAVYDTITNVWSAVKGGNITGVNNDITGILIIEEEVFIVGNFNILSDGTSDNGIVVYNTNTNVWSDLYRVGSVYPRIFGISNVNANIYVGGTFNMLVSNNESVDNFAKFSKKFSTIVENDSTINGNIYQNNQLTTSYTLSNIGKYISPRWIGDRWAL